MLPLLLVLITTVHTTSSGSCNPKNALAPTDDATAESPTTTVTTPSPSSTTITTTGVSFAVRETTSSPVDTTTDTAPSMTTTAEECTCSGGTSYSTSSMFCKKRRPCVPVSGDSCSVTCPEGYDIIYQKTNLASPGLASSSASCTSSAWNSLPDYNLQNIACLAPNSSIVDWGGYAATGCTSLKQYACPQNHNCDFTKAVFVGNRAMCRVGVIVADGINNGGVYTPSDTQYLTCESGTWTNGGAMHCVQGTYVTSICAAAVPGAMGECSYGRCWIYCINGSNMTATELPSSTEGVLCVNDEMRPVENLDITLTNVKCID